MVDFHSSQVHVRSFDSGDIEAVVALWNRCLPFDPISEDRFWRLFLLDPNFAREGALIAEVEDQIVGFLQAMHPIPAFGTLNANPEQGWITVFFVDPEHRRRRIGTQLLHAGTAYLKGRGAKRVTVNGYAPYYVFPGVDVRYTEALQFLDSSGFQHVSEAVAMRLPLRQALIPEDVLTRRALLQQQGIEFRWFTRADTLPLLEFAQKQFPYWHTSLVYALQNDHLDIMLAIQGSQVIGFSQWQNPLTDPPTGAKGRFGPVGVDASLRGQGIGAVIFYTLVEQVQARGADELWFGWAGGRNLSFYQRIGCEVFRDFRLFKITI